nr:carboxypeptidase-like regulatory domain-containing protein [Candidatus Freyarchaeota archaeon]
MSQKKSKKYALSLIIISSLILVMAIPLILPNTQTVLPPLYNTNTNTQSPPSTTSKSNPQPVDLWWNYNWGFRREINITEPNYVDRINDTAVVHLTFPNGHCANNSVRVLYYNQTTSSWVEVPSQVENAKYSGNHITSCDLIFLVNVTKGGTSTYYVYYNDTYTGQPKTYATPLNVNVVGTSYFTFSTGVIEGTYRIRNLWNDVDDDASFQVFKINGENIVPTSGRHRGIDRIDADDPERFGECRNNELNWTAEIVESGPVRIVVRVSKTSTDVFASAGGGGNYGPMNKTYVFYAYQGVVSVNVECNVGWVPIYDFATVVTSSQWEFYIDSYDAPGTAYDLKWTDREYGIQPQNYLALVRSDGLGFGLLGSPEWPKDLSGGTSMEFGRGIDGSVSSFGIRNDARNGQSAISMPFHYYVVGVTGGYNKIVDAWYQVNHPVTSNVGSETRIFYPLTVNVTDNFGNPIPDANVTVYDQPGPSDYNTSGTTNSQGLCTFRIYENYTSDQYWIQAYVNTSYKNYTSQAFRWNPIENFTGSSSTLNIAMNITSIYVEVWDRGLKSRVQNANVTLNYTDPSLEDISQFVNEYFANCSFYAYADENITINVSIDNVPKDIHEVYVYGTTTPAERPIELNASRSFVVELDLNISASSTRLTSVNGSIITGYWSDS